MGGRTAPSGRRGAVRGSSLARSGFRQQQVEGADQRGPANRRAVAGKTWRSACAPPTRRATPRWTRPTGLSAVLPAGPATPVTDTAKIDASARHGTLRHRRRGLGADCAICRDRLGGHPEQLHLGLVRVGHEAALDHIRRTGDRGQRGVTSLRWRIPLSLPSSRGRGTRPAPLRREPGFQGRTPSAPSAIPRIART